VRLEEKSQNKQFVPVQKFGKYSQNIFPKYIPKYMGNIPTEVLDRKRVF